MTASPPLACASYPTAHIGTSPARPTGQFSRSHGPRSSHQPPPSVKRHITSPLLSACAVSTETALDGSTMAAFTVLLRPVGWVSAVARQGLGRDGVVDVLRRVDGKRGQQSESGWPECNVRLLGLASKVGEREGRRLAEGTECPCRDSSDPEPGPVSHLARRATDAATPSCHAAPGQNPGLGVIALR